MKNLILILVFLLIATAQLACDSAPEEKVIGDEMEQEQTGQDEQERVRDEQAEFELWLISIECFLSTEDPDFEGIVFEMPPVFVVDAPCGREEFAGCNYGIEQIEIGTNHYFNFENDTPINETLFVHEYKHNILWQATGYPDPNHVGFWYSIESPCPDSFLIGDH